MAIRATGLHLIVDQPEIFAFEADHPRAGIGIQRVTVGGTGSDQLACFLPRVNFSVNEAQIGRTDPMAQGGSNQLAMIGMTA